MKLKSINDRDFVLILVTIVTTSLLLIRLISDVNALTFLTGVGHNIDFLIVWLILMTFVILRLLEQNSKDKVEMNQKGEGANEDFNLKKVKENHLKKEIDQRDKDLEKRNEVIRSQNTIINSLVFNDELDRVNGDIDVIGSSNQLKILLEIVDDTMLGRSDYEEVLGYYIGISAYAYINNLREAGVGENEQKTLNYIEELVNEKFEYVEVVNYGLSVSFDSEHHQSKIPIEDGVEVNPFGFEIINSANEVVIKKAPVSK